MDWLRPNRLLDAVTSTDVVVATLWVGLAALTITLLLLMRTRWGQSRPMRKCVVLSLLAHLLLVGYATTVQIVASAPIEAEGPVIHVSISDEAFKPREINEQSAVNNKPWETFAHEPLIRPSPVEPDRAEQPGMPKLERPTAPKPQDFTGEPALGNLALDDAVRPEPERLPAEGPAGRLSPRKSAEPIVAPAAERRPDVEAESPSAPEVARRDSAQTPSLETGREHRAGLPSVLVDQPRPVPRMQDVPSVPQPRDSLSDVADMLVPPARGTPADRASEPQMAEDASQPEAASEILVGREEVSADHLRPPSLTMSGGHSSTDRARTVSIPRESETVGPPVLPVPRQAERDREIPDLYRLRVDPDRARLAEQLGATAQTEEAVKQALAWLAENQEPDGRWSAKAHGGGRESRVSGRDRQRAGLEADTGMTGLALLAFLASGHTHREGGYRATVQRGLDYLVRVQQRDGGLGGRATTFAYMYCHAMATFALSEAHGMTGDSSLREPVRRAVYRTLGAQNTTSGGWRYYPGDPGDTSQLGWQLMALKSAELAGIPTPNAAKRGATRFLESVASGNYGGLAAYRPGEAVSRPMTAEALACRQFLGIHPGHPAAREAGDYLLAEVPGEGANNFYYWYYGTLAMYQLQGAHWQRWNRPLRETLVGQQRKTGETAGSWDPDTVWGGYGGRVYSTAMATLCLEVYYRFLPLYVEVASVGQARR